MTPEMAVAKVAEIVGPWSDFTEDEIFDELDRIGMPESVADRALRMTQIAWGRVLLDGLGVHFQPGYFCFDADGEVVESGLLAEEPHFVAAMQQAKQYAGSPGFARLALMSADVAGVNSLMKEGSQPENLYLSPAAISIEPPTEAGSKQIHQTLLERAKSEAFASRANKKSWWKFW